MTIIGLVDKKTHYFYLPLLHDLPLHLTNSGGGGQGLLMGGPESDNYY